MSSEQKAQASSEVVELTRVLREQHDRAVGWSSNAVKSKKRSAVTHRSTHRRSVVFVCRPPREVLTSLVAVVVIL